MKRIWLAGLAAILAACSTEAPVAPTMDATMGRGNPQVVQTVTVMQQNMYVGADVDAVIRALLTEDPDSIAAALQEAVETLQNTDVVARAGAIAAQIGKTRPHIVGLQEVSTIQVGALVIPFLPILQAALSEADLDYGVCPHTNFTVSPAAGVDLTDADVLLYDRSRVSDVTCGAGGLFSYQIGVLGITRGWGSLTGAINGVAQTFVVTHLEAGNDNPLLDALRAAQAAELVGVFGGSAPVTLLGDFNAFPGSDAYNLILAAGFTDFWAARHPGAPGYSCCLLPDLSNRTAPFNQRIDYVFAKGMGAQGQMLLVGNTPAARIPGPSYLIWPSDHAGLVGTFLTPTAGTK